MPKGGYAVQFLDLKPDNDSLPRTDTTTVLGGSGRRPFIGGRSAVLLAASAVLAVIFAFLINSRHRRAVQAKTESFEIIPFSTEVGQQFSPAVSPDGTKVAFVWNGDGAHYTVYVKSVSEGTASKLTNSRTQELHPSW